MKYMYILGCKCSHSTQRTYPTSEKKVILELCKSAFFWHMSSLIWLPLFDHSFCFTFHFFSRGGGEGGGGRVEGRGQLQNFRITRGPGQKFPMRGGGGRTSYATETIKSHHPLSLIHMSAQSDTVWHWLNCFSTNLVHVCVWLSSYKTPIFCLKFL